MNFTAWARETTAPIITPIVAFLDRLKFSPDLLTVIGMLGHLPVAYLIIIGRFTTAGLLLAFFALFDALDGPLARLQNAAPRPFGAFLDSALDRLAEIILFGGFLLYAFLQDDLLLFIFSFLACTGSLMVSYARARAEGLGIECKVGLFGRVERYILIVILLLFAQPLWIVIALAPLTYLTFIQRMIHVAHSSAAPNSSTGGAQ